LPPSAGGRRRSLIDAHVSRPPVPCRIRGRRRICADVGRSIRRRVRRAHGGIHEFDRFRQIACPRRHRRFDRSRPCLGQAGLLAPDEVETLVRDSKACGRMWRRHADLGPGARGRPHESRGCTSRADRTGRGAAPHRPSRNDQVATDMRLWLRRTIDGLDRAMVEMERSLSGWRTARARRSCRHDAYPTGTARSLCPSPAGYVEMLERDRGRLADCRRGERIAARLRCAGGADIH